MLNLIEEKNRESVYLPPPSSHLSGPTQSNKKGDLYVTFEVLFLKTLTDDQKAKLKDVLA